MRVLHLSHHYGCLKDHQYVCDELGIELTNQFSLWNDILPKGSYVMTENLANQIWEKNQDYFNYFDFITTSDTAPLSRIILQNLDKFNGKLNVWICNRFNYEMYEDVNYHELIKKYIDHEKVKFIPYTEFEKVWANKFNIQFSNEVIRPIGLSIDKKLSEFDSDIGFDGDYSCPKKPRDLLISRYHNDNIFQDSKSICKSFGLSSEIAKYRGYSGLEELKNLYSAYLIFPDQYSKLVTFELMNIGIPTIIPSEKFLLNLITRPNYWFGSGIIKETISLCEWYNEYYDKFALYIDDYSEIKDAVDTINLHKTEICGIMKTCSETHIQKTLDQWRSIYND
jgi:hypothetical protein